MKILTLLLLLALVWGVGCTTKQERGIFSQSTSSFDQTSPHFTSALELRKRKPKKDAEAFFESGYQGYIMTTGGLMVPIGVKDFSYAEHYSWDILKVDVCLEPELKHIQSLLIDPVGPLTIQDRYISDEREYYLKLSGTYAKEFNRRMEDLITTKSEPVDSGNG